MSQLVKLQESVASDRQLIEMWVFGKSEHTQRYYLQEAHRFLQWVEKPLKTVNLADLQSYGNWLGSGSGLARSSQGRALSTVKSLLTFGNRIGVLQVNVGAAVKVPGGKDRLAERILEEAQVHRMIALEGNRRNALILRLLYTGGLRVSELCELKWRDLHSNGEAGQITVFGKGSKTRQVLLPVSIWKELQSFRGESGLDEPVFPSRKGKGHLDPSQVHRIVDKAAERAGITGNVSPHWLRHAHASHSLDRGAPIHLVQQTLGHANIATTGKYLHARPSDSSARYLAT